MLNEDEQIKEKFIKEFSQKDTQYDYKAQCAIYGKELPIARLHDNIKGIKDAQSNRGDSGGAKIVSYNKNAFTSYGYEQSYNSNISEFAMQKYTRALNYIISHKQIEYLDGLNMLYWATSSKNTYVDSFSFFMNPDRIVGKGSTSSAIKRLLKDVCSGSLTYKQLDSISEINPNVSFYILGIKKNKSRLAIVFLYSQKFGKLLQNIAQHQKDMQISNDNYFVSLPTISKALISSKTTDDKSVQAFIKELFISIILGTSYPNSLLYRVVSKIKVEINKKNININEEITKKNKNINEEINKKIKK